MGVGEGMIRLILHLIKLKTRLFRYWEWKGEAGSSLIYYQYLKYGYRHTPDPSQEGIFQEVPSIKRGFRGV